MTLLIVDDEFYLVQGVKDLMDWEEYGITKVLTAYSAAQARAVFEEEDVDILLADVEMPRENGLSLIRWVREISPDTVCILLTGHENFQYAKTAIELRTFAYLVKPPTKETVSETITGAVKSYQENLRRHREEQNLHMVIFWRNLYSGSLSPDPDSIALYLEQYGIPQDILTDRYYYVRLCLLPQDVSAAGTMLRSEETAAVTVTSAGSLDNAPLLNAVEDGTGELSFPRLFHILQETISKDAWIAATDSAGYMISIGQRNGMTEGSARAGIEAVLKKLRAQYPSWKYVFYLFDSAPVAAAPYARELLQQFSMRILASSSGIVPVLETAVSSRSEEPALQAKDLPLQTWTEWLSAGRENDILLQIRAFLGKKDTIYSSRYLSAIYYGLLHAVFDAFSGRSESLTRFFDNASHVGDLAQVSSSADALLRWAEQILREAAAILTADSDAATVTEQVRAYVREHLSDPALGRADIADAVHMSPDYLSYVFHKESGTVLSAYITGERIAAAKKLLLTTDLGQQEIAEKVGFSGVPYFHRQFKKLVGTTPSAYRQNKGK